MTLAGRHASSQPQATRSTRRGYPPSAMHLLRLALASALSKGETPVSYPLLNAPLA